MTVSNVLRGRAEKTGSETRLRVMQAVHDLDYIPVRTAAQNRHITTNALGVVFIQEMDGAVGYPTFHGMCSQARRIDHDLTIFLRSEPDWVKPGTEAQFLDRRCDGFIFVGENRPEISEALVRHRVPVVECYNPAPPQGVARVVVDNAAAMRLAVETLAAQGHRRIAHLAGPTENREAQERRRGFCTSMQALTGQDCAEFIVQAQTWGDLWGFGGSRDSRETLPFAAQALEKVQKKGVTAVACCNDLYALAVWRLAEECGLRVPQDLSITGMDNIAESEQRGLTSVVPPFEQVGRAAVEAVMRVMEGEAAEDASVVLPVEIVKRQSVAAPPAL